MRAVKVEKAACLEHDKVGTSRLLRESKGQREKTMQQGDYVKVTGIDRFYVFLKEVQGMATLRVCSMHDPDKSTIAIAIDVFPVPATPVTSVVLPRYGPPDSISSISGTPIGIRSRDTA